MIKVFYGEDRVRAQKAVREFLGVDYEVVEGGDLEPKDLPSLLMGGSLFAEERAILVQDGLANKVISEELPKYLETPHRVALWEAKIDKRAGAYKAMKDKVEFCEFGLAKNANYGLVFEIYKVAKKDGRKAVEMLEKIKNEQEPMMFLGLMVSQAIKDYKANPGIREKRALKELSKLDMEMKRDSKLQPWTLVQAFLLRLASWR